MKTRNWNYSGDRYYPHQIQPYVDELSIGIYEYHEVGLSAQPVLSKTKTEFDFPYKIYGHEKKDIDRFTTYYKNSSGNFGIILNGIKGTGKSVMAKQLCNQLNLPVIVVTFKSDQFISFINNLQEDVVIFIDEFEKIYSERDSNILTLMDGVLNSEYRKTFIFTTNTKSVNEFMIDRPSRIRYIKEFTNLKIPVIEEIVDDLLIHTERKEKLIEYIAQLNLVTIDIVKSVINEVNIFNEDPEQFKDLFNVKKLISKYNIEEYDCDEEGEIIRFKREIPQAEIDSPLVKSNIGKRFYINGSHRGTLKKFEPGKAMVTYNTYNEDLGVYVDTNKLYIFTEVKNYNEHFVNNSDYV